MQIHIVLDELHPYYTAYDKKEWPALRTAEVDERFYMDYKAAEERFHEMQDALEELYKQAKP